MAAAATTAIVIDAGSGTDAVRASDVAVMAASDAAIVSEPCDEAVPPMVSDP